MRKLTFFILLGLPIISANAVTITFDDLTHLTSIPNGYNGLNWTNFGSLDSSIQGVNSGYVAGTISPKFIAYNTNGLKATISSSTPFNFGSAYLTASTINNYILRVNAYVGSSIVLNQTYTLSKSYPTLVNFGLSNIDKIEFWHDGYPSTMRLDNWFAIDNIYIPPLASDTLSSMNPNAYALRGAFIQQSAIVNSGLSYDCTTFDKNGICLSAGGRVTDTVNPATNSQGALVIASYRANDNWRIGGYLDQNLSSNDARGVNLDNSNPMGGVFAVWNQNTDGTGYQVRVAAGYSDKDVTISRSVFGTAEAGTGDSSLQSQAYSATVSRGFQINDTRWIASPYVGVRYTKIKRAGYTEDSSADVTAPLTYSALSQETTSALAGVRLNGQFGDKLNFMASAGVESDIAHNTGDYAATGVDGLTPIAFNENIRRVRPVAQAGVRYAIDKRQTFGANLHYIQEVFNSTHSVTGMVNYELGF